MSRLNEILPSSAKHVATDITSRLTPITPQPRVERKAMRAISKISVSDRLDHDNSVATTMLRILGQHEMRNRCLKDWKRRNVSRRGAKIAKEEKFSAAFAPLRETCLLFLHSRNCGHTGSSGYLSGFKLVFNRLSTKNCEMRTPGPYYVKTMTKT